MSIVWVTGARGFIGSHLSRYLAQNGDRVLGIGHGLLPPQKISHLGLSFWINGEIIGSNLSQLCEYAGIPELIFHLAGGSSVGASLQSPSEDFHRSVHSTAELLEWVRVNSPQSKIIFASSAAIYGNSSEYFLPETGNFIPYSPYGFHKRAAELLCQSYAHNFNLRIAIVRLFSVYGPGLCKQLLWDLCCRLSQSPQVLKLHGTGEEQRDWLFIEDAVRLLRLVGSYASTEPLIINGGTGIGTCVREVAEQLCQILGCSPVLEFSQKNRTGDPFSLIANTESLKSIGFVHEHQLNNGLKAYIQWFQKFEKDKIL